MRDLIPVSTLISVLTALCLAGCATHRAKSDGSDEARIESIDSGIDISYVLGHAHRRLLVQTKDNQIVAQSYLEHQILKESEIDREHYADFLKKAKTFVENPQRLPANQDLCRSPFTVTLRIGKDLKVVNGCRSTDEGALSHLLRDGEFLLYSKK